MPNRIYTSDKDNIRDWETISINPTTIHTSSRNPQEAKNSLMKMAALHSANALLNVSRYTTTGSEPSQNALGIPTLIGTHKYTIHHYNANLANIGKKNSKGTQTKTELLTLKNAKVIYPSKKIAPSLSIIFIKLMGLVFFMFLLAIGLVLILR